MALAHQQTSSTDHEQAAPEQGGGQRTSGGRGNGHANAERGDGEAGATVDLVRRIEKTFGRWEEAIASSQARLTSSEQQSRSSPQRNPGS